MGLNVLQGYDINPKELRRKVAEKLIKENQYCF